MSAIRVIRRFRDLLDVTFGVPADQDVVLYDLGTDMMILGASPGGPPSGAAGGDLSGTYPNPLFGAGIDRVDGVNEVRTLTITGAPTGGTFTITYLTFTTAPIAFNATAAQVQAALVLLPSIRAGGVVCAGGPLPAVPVTIERTGPWAAATAPNTFTTTDSLAGGVAPASSIVITTPAVPFAQNAAAVQIGAAGVYLANGMALKLGNSAGTSWIPGITRDASNSVVIRGGSGQAIFTADTSGRIGIGAGNVTIAAETQGFTGAVVVHNAEADIGGVSAVTEFTIVAGLRQVISDADLLRILNNGLVVQSRFNKEGFFVIGKFAAIPDADLDPNEGAWYLSAGLPVWKGKNGGGVVQSFDAGDHSARHENGGADEISIAGLDGTSTDLAAHLADATDAHDASAISFVPGGTIAATDVQAAIAEVAAEASGGAPVGASYVTTAAEGGLSNEQVLGTAVVMSGTFAARPAASVAGLLYFATDAGVMYRDTGAAWQAISVQQPQFDIPGYRSGAYYGTPSSAVSGGAFTLNDLFFAPFWLRRTITFDRIACNVFSGTVATAKQRLGIYADDGTVRPGALILDAGQADTSTTGDKTITISQTLDPGLYHLATVSQTAAATLQRDAVVVVAPMGSTTLAFSTAWKIAGISGALPNPAGAVVAAGNINPPRTMVRAS